MTAAKRGARYNPMPQVLLVAFVGTALLFVYGVQRVVKRI